MNTNDIEICGQSFDLDREHFSFEWPFTVIEEMSELAKLKKFPKLKSASFGSTNLNDAGLAFLCENTAIESLDLQDTQISNEGIVCLSRLKKLNYLRLKENYQLDDACMSSINKLEQLVDLQIHGTNITQNGLEMLTSQTLRNLLINPIDKAILLPLSKKLPQCSILIKGKAEFLNGKILWER
jgi:hypothetical protein